MNEGFATPFDIAPLPYFPPEPPLSLWLAVILFFSLLILIAYIPRRKGRVKTAEPLRLPFRETESVVEQCRTADHIRKEDLFEITRRLKLVIHAYEQTDLSSMGPDELERVWNAAAKENPLTDLTRLMIQADRLKFEGDPDEETSRALVANIRAALSQYKAYVRARMTEAKDVVAPR